MNGSSILEDSIINDKKKKKSVFPPTPIQTLSVS